jgi:hypothetical protein
VRTASEIPLIVKGWRPRLDLPDAGGGGAIAMMVVLPVTTRQS